MCFWEWGIHLLQLIFDKIFEENDRTESKY